MEQSDTGATNVSIVVFSGDRGTPVAGRSLMGFETKRSHGTVSVSWSINPSITFHKFIHIRKHEQSRIFSIDAR
jgi:hypothetical protein